MGSVWRWLTDPHIGRPPAARRGRGHRRHRAQALGRLHRPGADRLPRRADLLVRCVPFSSVELGWAPILVGLALLLWGGFGRCSATSTASWSPTSGCSACTACSPQEATMPLSRILDIAVDKPLPGSDPGLRPLHLRVGRAGAGPARDPYVARPDERNLAIQRVVQRAGLRGQRPQMPAETADSTARRPAARSPRIASRRPTAEMRAASTRRPPLRPPRVRRPRGST